MEIRVYTPELKFLGVIESFKSLIWRRKYYEPGQFELHAPGTKENIELLKAGNIITKRGSKEAGVIGEFKDTEKGRDSQIIRKGYFLSVYLDRRLIKTTVTFNGTYENAMRHLVTQVTPIPLLELGKLNNYKETARLQVTYKQLGTYLTKIAKCSGLGYRIRPDFKTKKLYFEVYSGVDHTTKQKEEPHVIFSGKYENLNKVDYAANDNKYKNKFYIGGQGEGKDRIVEILDYGATGTDLREVFIDAKDLKQGDLTEQQYREVLRQRGKEKAENFKRYESMEAEVADTNFKYKVHWDLGDKVTALKKEWGLTLHKRITEVEEVYENGGITITPVLGNIQPDTIDLSEE